MHNNIFKIFGLTLFILATCIACSQKKQPASETSTEIHWITQMDSALTLAAAQTKPVMVDFMAEWCPPCQKMEKTTFNQTEVVDKSNHFITVRIDVDKQGELANAYNGNARKYGGVGIPNILFMDSNKNKLKHIIGYQSPENLIAEMDSVLIQFEEKMQ